MAKRTNAELEVIKNFIEGTYSRFGNLLMVDTTKPYDPDHSELGYCYKYTDAVTHNVVYRVICSRLGIPDTDFRILMHEYGHIYLTHLDGIHEELDVQICNLLRDHRGELIDYINESCGIDFADKLLERIIDDPNLNHSLHNIAMDMEVNSSVLSKEDIEEMEADISSVHTKKMENLLERNINTATDPEVKKKYQDALDKMRAEAIIKLIVPERYNLGTDQATGELIPFPNDLTYSEYLLLIIKHLDQFVKMLVSIKMGGNGDTSQITQQDIQNILNNMARNWSNKSDAYKQGYNDALNDYKNNQIGQKQNQPGGNSGQQQQQNQGNQQQQQGMGGPGGNDSGQQQGGQGNQQGPGQGQSSDQGTSSSGNGGNGGNGQQGQPQNGGQGNDQSGQQGNQPSNSGNSGDPQADYDQGYQDALNDIANNGGQGGNNMQSLSDFFESMGISGDGQSPYKGTRPDNEGSKNDHRTEERDNADRKREVGQIQSGGSLGCGNSGSPYMIRTVDRDVDLVDMALREVMQHVRSRVVKQDTRKDVMKLYNKGVVRSVIAPTVSRKVTISNEPKLVYLIDVSGSMNTRLIDRILKTISKSMSKLSRGLRYDIITWSTELGEHLKDIDPKKGVPKISSGGGTRLAKGIKYFRDHYDNSATLIIISDFEDYLEEWNKEESQMSEYTMYGFNYGLRGESDSVKWKNLKVRNFDS